MSVEAVNNSNYQAQPAQESQNYSQNNVNAAQEASGVAETQSYSNSSDGGAVKDVSDDVEMSQKANNTRRSRVASLDDYPEEEYHSADSAHEAGAAGETSYAGLYTADEAAEHAVADEAGELGSGNFKRSEETAALIDDLAGKYAEANNLEMDSAEVQAFRDKVQILDGTNKDDKINVTKSAQGGIDVNVNGKVTHYSEEDAKYLVIDAGNGNDEVTVADDVTIGLHIAGGSGDDVLKGGAGNDVMYDYRGKTQMSGGDGNDQLVAHGLSEDGKTYYDNIIVGGGGNDYIEGGGGNDLIHGGDGNDVIYGLSGSDTIYGGEDDDYIDGGEDGDKIDGGVGNDRLVGGNGDDKLLGSGGDDLLIGGRGKDEMDGGSGADKFIAQKALDEILNGTGDEIEERYSVDIPDNIKVNAEGLEKERIESDLEMLAATEHGKKLFSSVSLSERTITIEPFSSGNKMRWHGPIEGERGMDTTVYYNTSKISLGQDTAWDERAPVIGLFHELIHCYNAINGNLDFGYYDENGTRYDEAPKDRYTVRGLEYQAVGMDDPEGIIEQNDEDLTENGMRSSLGYARRERY